MDRILLRGGSFNGRVVSVADANSRMLTIRWPDKPDQIYKATDQLEDGYPVWMFFGETLRPSWDEYFTGIAEAVAQRATCNRAKVGAVLVSRDNRILSTGYNGSAPGEPHCIDVGCDIVDNHCQRTQHAEVNAVAFAARYGVPIRDSRLYLWINDGATVATVCRECAKVLKAAGVTW